MELVGSIHFRVYAACGVYEVHGVRGASGNCGVCVVYSMFGVYKSLGVMVTVLVGQWHLRSTVLSYLHLNHVKDLSQLSHLNHLIWVIGFS